MFNVLQLNVIELKCQPQCFKLTLKPVWHQPTISPTVFFNNAAFNDVILKSLLMSHLAWDLMGTINSGATVFWNKMRSSQLVDIQWVARCSVGYRRWWPASCCYPSISTLDWAELRNQTVDLRQRKQHFVHPLVCCTSISLSHAVNIMPGKKPFPPILESRHPTIVETVASNEGETKVREAFIIMESLFPVGKRLLLLSHLRLC